MWVGMFLFHPLHMFLCAIAFEQVLSLWGRFELAAVIRPSGFRRRANLGLLVHLALCSWEIIDKACASISSHLASLSASESDGLRVAPDIYGIVSILLSMGWFGFSRISNSTCFVQSLWLVISQRFWNRLTCLKFLSFNDRGVSGSIYFQWGGAITCENAR